MSRQFVFPSLNDKHRRYTLYGCCGENPAYHWRHGNSFVSIAASWFTTLGDREVQHSPDCMVNLDDCVDFFESLQASLDAFPVEDDDNNCLRYSFNEPDRSRQQIEFAAGLKYSEAKTTYYCLGDCKKSTSEEKRHDRRWQRLDRPEEGIDEVTRVFRILTGEGEFWGFLDGLRLAMNIAEVVKQDDGDWTLHCHLKKSDLFKRLGDGAVYKVTRALQAIYSFTEAVETVRRCRHNANRIRENAARKAEYEAASATEC